MLTRTTLAIAAVVVFGAASAVQAGSKDDDGGPGGGYRIGPLGQPMGGPFAWRGVPPNVYGYVPRAYRDNARYYGGPPPYWPAYEGE